MTTDAPPPNRGLDNETRQALFLALVDAEDSRTPSALADTVDVSRELAYHHLRKLVEMGLVVRSNGEYRCQPVFTDPSFDDVLINVVAELVPAVANRVEFPDDEGPDAMDAVVFNCLKMAIAMNVLDPDEVESQ